MILLREADGMIFGKGCVDAVDGPASGLRLKIQVSLTARVA